MSSNLRVNNILPSVGTNVAIGTAGGSVTLTGTTSGTFNSSGIATFSSGIVVSAGSTAAPSISPSGDSNTGIFFPSPDTVAIGEGGIEALRVDSAGRLLVGITSANTGGGVLQVSNGITFPGTQSASADPNTLDDYEKGSWVPADTSTGVTFTSSDGRYTKIGDVVIAMGNVQYPVNSNGLSAGFSIPFVAGSGRPGGFIRYTNSGVWFSIHVNATTAGVALYDINGSAITNTTMSNKRLDFEVIYKTTL